MSQVTEAVLSLQHDLRDYHENTEKCYVHLRHLIKKVEDGIIVIPQDQRDECIKLLKKTKDTSNELMECFHNLAKLADEGCDKIQAQNCDVTSQSLDRLKPSTCDNVLRRSKHARVSADSAIGSAGSSVLSRSEFEDNCASAALENEDTSIGQIRINDLSKPPTQETNIGNFQDLNISSMESSSSNEEPEAETGKACANWDPKLGLITSTPERDSVAFANAIESTDKSLIDAQGNAVRADHRSMNRNNGNILQLKDSNYSNKDCDV